MPLTYDHPEAVGPFLNGLNIKNNLSGLASLVISFLRLPYENFTKIIHARDFRDKAEYLRMPDILWDEHRLFGTGGTCFSLTYFFETVLKTVGFDCYPVMVDRSYGKDTHCAVIVRLGGQKYLVDPGFCLSRPIPLTDRQMEHKLPHNTYIVTPTYHPHKSCHSRPRLNHSGIIPAPRLLHAGTSFAGTSGNLVNLNARDPRFRLHHLMASPGGQVRGDDIAIYNISTKQLGRTKPRYLLKDSPAPPAEFLKFWEDSFNWPMMRHLCATRLSNDGFLFLRDSFLRKTAHEDKRQENIKSAYDEKVSGLFGIAPKVIKQASEIVMEAVVAPFMGPKNAR